MPTYEYVCLKCQAQFDVSQRISDAPLTQCPKDHCPGKKWGKGDVQRGVGGGAGLIFKGSGFYQTDYRSDSYKKSAAADSKSTSSETKSESNSSATDSKSSETKPAKIDSKPAAASEPKPKGKGKKAE
jgi:putative FmdB family regulatory protein